MHCKLNFVWDLCWMVFVSANLEVQQRGITATQEILTALLDGVEAPTGGLQSKVYVADIMPNRPD